MQTPIKDDARILYRSRYDHQAAFPNSFSVGPGSYFGWLKIETRLYVDAAA